MDEPCCTYHGLGGDMRDACMESVEISTIGELNAANDAWAAKGEALRHEIAALRAENAQLQTEVEKIMVTTSKRIVDELSKNRELRMALADMLSRFAPDDDGLSDAEIACADRARRALEAGR